MIIVNNFISRKNDIKWIFLLSFILYILLSYKFLSWNSFAYERNYLISSSTVPTSRPPLNIFYHFSDTRNLSIGKENDRFLKDLLKKISGIKLHVVQPEKIPLSLVSQKQVQASDTILFVLSNLRNT